MPHPKLIHCHPLGTCIREPSSTKQPCSTQANKYPLQQPAFRPKYRHFLCQLFSHHTAVFALSAKITLAKFKLNTPSLSLRALQYKNLSFSRKFNKERTRAGYIASSSVMAHLFPECGLGHPGKTDRCNSRGSCRVGFYQGSGHEHAPSFSEV